MSSCPRSWQSTPKRRRWICWVWRCSTWCCTRGCCAQQMCSGTFTTYEWIIKTPYPKCRLFFNIVLLTNFAALCWTDFIDWRDIHTWLLYSTQLVNCCPHGRRNYTVAPLPSLWPPPPSPLHTVNVPYIQTVCGCGGGGCWVVLWTTFCRCLTLCFWPDLEPTKLLHHPKQKWLAKTTFRDWCF
jgi:hypothetical protein